MGNVGKIYRIIFPILLAALFSASLYIFQIIPVEYGTIIYDYSILALICLFLLVIFFVGYSYYRAGKLLFKAKPGKANKSFLYLGLMFLGFGIIFGGYEFYLGETVHGSYPAGPVMFLAALGGFFGWRLSVAVYSNGIRPPCRNFIPWEKIKAFYWGDEVYLYPAGRAWFGRLIIFDIASAEGRKLFQHLIRELPLRAPEKEIPAPDTNTDSSGMVGYYLAAMEEGDSLQIKSEGGTEALLTWNDGKKYNQQWEEVNFSNLKKFLLALAESSDHGDGVEKNVIKYRRLPAGEEEKAVFCRVQVKLEPNRDKISLFLRQIQD